MSSKDSLENALETPRRHITGQFCLGNSKEARPLKVDTELSGDMHTAFGQYLDNKLGLSWAKLKFS